MEAPSASTTPQHAPDHPQGLPPTLRAGIESLANIPVHDVRVKRNSSEPAKIGALAYASGSDIHIASGQEKHLPHEAWHIVQQRQGRVKAMIQRKGVSVNNDATLEQEADVMGARASAVQANPLLLKGITRSAPAIAQLMDSDNENDDGFDLIKPNNKPNEKKGKGRKTDGGTAEFKNNEGGFKEDVHRLKQKGKLSDYGVGNRTGAKDNLTKKEMKTLLRNMNDENYVPGSEKEEVDAQTQAENKRKGKFRTKKGKGKNKQNMPL